MTVIKLAVTAMVVTTGANIVAGKKRQKAQQKAQQEAAYFEGAAPIIPVSNELMIEGIGDENVSPEGAAPDFREALAGSYGGAMYDTQSFDRTPEQILIRWLRVGQYNQKSIKTVVTVGLEVICLWTRCRKTLPTTIN